MSERHAPVVIPESVAMPGSHRRSPATPIMLQLQESAMKASAPACAVLAIVLSACASGGGSRVEPYRTTRADITSTGGTCSGRLCTSGLGHLWDCGGGGACFRVETTTGK